MSAAGIAPSLSVRLAASVYESLLLFAIAFAAAFLLLSLAGWTYPLRSDQRWILQGWVFLALGAYFVTCWSRTGQTLALKTWRLRVTGPDGRPLGIGRAVLRYLLAWHLLLPGLVYIVIAAPGAKQAAYALLLGALPAFAVPYLHAGRTLLHDWILGTRVLREHAA